MILETLDDVMLVMDSSCTICRDFWGFPDSKFTDVRLDGAKAIFSCRRGDKYEALSRVETTDRDFEKLSNELIKTIRSDSNGEFCIENVRELLDKARIYATFAPNGKIFYFDGVCNYCFNEVPMHVENRKLWTSCSSCASILADSSS